jgi:hypothetical protein
VNRRQFLRAAVLAVPATGVARVVSGRDTDTSDPPTPTATPTPTPTEAVATPTSSWEPRGRLAVPGASETVLTPDGRTAFVATVDGFAAIDLSDPGQPTLLTRETDISPLEDDGVMGGIYDVKYDDGRLLVAGPAGYDPDVFRGFALFDVTDPASPTLVGGYRTTFPVHNCYLDGRHAYLTGNDGDANPLVVVDVVNAREVARWSVTDHDERWQEVNVGLRTLHDVWVQGDYAYLAHWDAGTWILDVSEPTDPAYVADIREQSLDRLTRLDGPSAWRTQREPPGNDHYVATDPAGDLLGVGTESWNSNFGKEETTPGPDDPGGPGGIALYDVSEPATPVHRATIDPPPTADPNYNGVWTTAHNFEITDSRLYSSWYQGGVKVHDVSDPTSPEELRHFRRSATTSFWTAQFAAASETVVATSHENPADRDDSGVLYTFPDAPRETPTPTPSATATRSPAVSPPPRDATAPASPTSPAGTPPTTATQSAPAAVEAADSTNTDTSADGPGFGPLAALAALGLGAWRLVGVDGPDGTADSKSDD